MVLVPKFGISTSRGGGTGPAGPVLAGPLLRQKTNIFIFHVDNFKTAGCWC